MVHRPFVLRQMLLSRMVWAWLFGSIAEWANGDCCSVLLDTLLTQRPDTRQLRSKLLAVVWAAKKAHLFIAGADVELIVDHRPLISIINWKTLDELSTPRIVRLKEKLTPCRLNAMWRPGIEHKVVDCFSRHPVTFQARMTWREKLKWNTPSALSEWCEY